MAAFSGRGVIAPLEVKLLGLPPPTGSGAHCRLRALQTMSITQMAGILPAVIFPAATLLQLARIIQNRSTTGVSVMTWLLFGFANLGIYVYAERYTEWQAIIGMLLTAIIDFVIVAIALFERRRRAPWSGRAVA